MANYLKDELRGSVPCEQASEIIRKVARGSSVIRLSRVEPMTSDTMKIPVMTSGAGAYWVGEGKRIGASGATWIFPELHAATARSMFFPNSKTAFPKRSTNHLTRQHFSVTIHRFQQILCPQ